MIQKIKNQYKPEQLSAKEKRSITGGRGGASQWYTCTPFCSYFRSEAECQNNCTGGFCEQGIHPCSAF
jgi:hypothetical protein